MEGKIEQNTHEAFSNLLKKGNNQKKGNKLPDSFDDKNTITDQDSEENVKTDPASEQTDAIDESEKIQKEEQSKQSSEPNWYILKIIAISAAVMVVLFVIISIVMDYMTQKSAFSAISTEAEGLNPEEVPDDIVTHYSSVTQDFDPVAVENDFYKLVVKPGNEVDEMDIQGFCLTLEVENRSKGVGIQFCVDSLYLDGFRVLPESNWSLDKGEKKEYLLLVEEEDIKNLGHAPYSSLNLYYSVYDPEHDVRNPLDRYCVNIYPDEMEKYEKYIRKEGPTDVVLYDTEEMQLICIGTDRDDDFHYLNFYLMNRTDRGMNCILDGFEMDDSEIGGIYETKMLHAGCSTEFALSFPVSEFGEIHLSEMEKISFCFYVEDEEQKTMVDDEILSFKPVKRKVSHPYK